MSFHWHIPGLNLTKNINVLKKKSTERKHSTPLHKFLSENQLFINEGSRASLEPVGVVQQVPYGHYYSPIDHGLERTKRISTG